MQPIDEIPRDWLGSIEGLVFDLDDTFLDHGELGADSYRALSNLKAAGFVLLAATGRPAGWGEVLARQWPVSAVISENGAIADLKTKREVQRIDDFPRELRSEVRAALDEMAAQVQREFPQLLRTDDAHARISDVTFDIGERCSVSQETIGRVLGFAHELGVTTTVSSVHLHLTLDRHDKATGCLRVLRDYLGYDTTRARMRFAFIGDSGNDAACFAAFRTSIGVANLRGRPTVPPRFITTGARGAGFVEAAEVLLASRA